MPLLLVPLLLLLLPAAASAQWEPAYEAAVRRYASGDGDGAVADMAAWPEGRLRSEITAANVLRRKAERCRDCPAALESEKVPLAAAIPLHTSAPSAPAATASRPGCTSRRASSWPA